MALGFLTSLLPTNNVGFSLSGDTILCLTLFIFLISTKCLSKEYKEYKEITQDSIKKLNFELKLANEQAEAAKERANAVQSAVEKVRSNTTITVKGAEEVKNNNQK